MTLSIAPSPPDHPDAAALIAASVREQARLYAPEHRFALSPEEMIAVGVVYLLARDADGRTVGGGGFAPRQGYAELKGVVTAPHARGRGVASAVVAALEAEARCGGFAVMRLETGRESPQAVALYTRCGYARRGPFGAYAANPSSVFMEKRLA